MSWKGKRSEEWKTKVRDSLSGKKRPPEVGQKISAAKKGKKTGIVPVNAFKKGFTPWNKGKTGYKLNFSVEQRKFLSENMRRVACREWTGEQRRLAGERAKITRNRLGTTTSLETRLKMSKAQKVRFKDKTKHPKWIVDRSQLKKTRLQAYDVAYKQWMLNVKNRDGWRCKIANGDCSGRLEAHHILPWRSHPELRYQLNNGITLCHYHHPRKREDESRLSPYFQELVLKGN